MECYIVWTGDGSMIDATEYETYDEAYKALCDWNNVDVLYCVEHCNGDEWSVYLDDITAANDEHGVYATTITRVS